MMINKASLRILAIGLAGLLSFGCTKLQVVDRSMDFNEALEISVNKTLLLNAVRASKRYPMHFSRVGQLTATPNVNANLGLNVPFGGDATNLYTASPSIGLSHSDNIIVTALDNQDFYHGILRPVGFDIINQYAEQGWPAEMLIYLFIERLELSSAATTALLGRARSACQDEPMPEGCMALDSAGQRLLDLREDGRQQSCRQDMDAQMPGASGLPPYDYAEQVQKYCFRHKLGLNRVQNDPLDERSFQSFQMIAAALWILDIDTALGNSTSPFRTVKQTITKSEKPNTQSTGGKILESLQTKEEQEKASTRVLLIRIGIPRSASQQEIARLNSLCNHIATPPQGQKICEIHFQESAFEDVVDSAGSGEIGTAESAKRIRTSLRSPQGMMFYLGEIIHAQTVENRGTLSWLFKVETGPGEGAAVSVQHEGTTYSIPPGSAGKRASHNSMQVLALIYQILNLHKKGTGQPFVPTVISTGG